jgi:hypothetical protein
MTAKEDKRCHHCGNPVRETRHTRTSYRVGYYEIYGGDVEPVTMMRSGDEGETITILRLTRPAVWLTCADCYRDPEVRAERESLFAPER